MSLSRFLRRLRSFARARKRADRPAATPTAPAPGWSRGHFYSPYPDLQEVARRESVLFGPAPREIPAVDLREEEQLRLLDELAAYYPSHPFSERKRAGVRFFFENPNYSYGDAVVLYCMIRHLRPKRIIEVGSGYTSCAILDTNERAFEGRIECTFIEPYPELLSSLLSEGDDRRFELLSTQLQDVDVERFADLADGDILFVDSSHVSKVGSDVNHLFFEILPRLSSGVHIHFHDIEYPFEYPKEWIYQGRAWTEAYLLRAFLQYNSAFQVELYNSFIGRFHRDALSRAMPIALKNPGSSIWLRKVSSSAS